MYSRSIVCVLAAALLAACATPYQPAGRGGGYSHRKVDDGAFIVSFVGNGSTSKERANDFARLRAAEIGQELGYRYIAVIGEVDSSTSQIVPLATHTNTNVIGTGYGATANSSTVPLMMGVYNPRTSIGALFFMELPDKRYLELYHIDKLIPGLRRKYDLD